MGPYGEAITRDTLPAPGWRGRWTIRRKIELLAAVNGGVVSELEAFIWYGLSASELEAWRRHTLKAGLDGVSSTRNQKHRGARMRNPAALFVARSASKTGA